MDEKQVGLLPDWTNGVNLEVLRWAREYTAAFIEEVDRVTAEMVSGYISDFVRSGDTVEQVAKRIAGMPGSPFSRERAKTIAVTEVTRAYSEGNIVAYKKSGLINGKQWDTANDELVCPICGPLDGAIVRLDEEFEGGFYGPPAHPRCRCSVSPILFEDEETGEETFEMLGERYAGVGWAAGRAPGLALREFIESIGPEVIREIPKEITPLPPVVEADTRTLFEIIPGAKIDTVHGAQRRFMTYYTDEEIRAAQKIVDQIARDGNIRMRMPTEVLDDLLNDGFFKNQHATRTSHGTLDPAFRAASEEKMFGIPWGSSKPSDYPVYGYVGSPSTEKNLWYGNMRISFRDEIKRRTTISFGDSLYAGSRGEAVPIGLGQTMDEAAPLIQRNHDLKLAASKRSASAQVDVLTKNSGYVEAQIHGRTTLADIDRIEFLAADPPSAAQVARLEELGIKWGWYDE